MQPQGLVEHTVINVLPEVGIAIPRVNLWRILNNVALIVAKVNVEVTMFHRFRSVKILGTGKRKIYNGIRENLQEVPIDLLIIFGELEITRVVSKIGVAYVANGLDLIQQFRFVAMGVRLLLDQFLQPLRRLPNKMNVAFILQIKMPTSMPSSQLLEQ